MNPVNLDDALLQRRKILLLAGASTLLCCGVSSGLTAADALPKAGINTGDLLVTTADNSGTPLKASDIKVGGKPLLVYPFDIDTKKPRSESRLNKLLLVRVSPKDLREDARARSVDGVLAFSAVCTHQGCDVTEWKASEKTLLCFCHSSQFNPVNNGAVKLAWVHKFKDQLWTPLMSTGGNLVFAGGTPDRMFRAFNAKNGKVLWEFPAPSGVIGTPASYEVNGEQYIAVQAGWGVDAQRLASAVDNITGKKTLVTQGGSLMVFKLPKR